MQCLLKSRIWWLQQPTQSVAATAPASTSAVVVFNRKKQLAIIANCVFPHNLVAATADTDTRPGSHSPMPPPPPALPLAQEA